MSIKLEQINFKSVSLKRTTGRFPSSYNVLLHISVIFAGSSRSVCSSGSPKKVAENRLINASKISRGKSLKKKIPYTFRMNPG